MTTVAEAVIFVGEETVAVKFCGAKEEEIRALFRIISRTLLRTVVARTGSAHTTVWSFLRRELKMFPYKLQFCLGAI